MNTICVDFNHSSVDIKIFISFQTKTACFVDFYHQVVSYGLKVGPSGVSLQLEQDGSIVQSTTSVAQGR